MLCERGVVHSGNGTSSLQNNPNKEVKITTHALCIHIFGNDHDLGAIHKLVYGNACIYGCKFADRLSTLPSIVSMNSSLFPFLSAIANIKKWNKGEV